MKKTIAIILSLLLIISLCACSQPPKPEKAVHDFFNSFKNLELDSMDSSLIAKDDIEELFTDSESLILLRPIAENISYKIISTEQIDDENAIVTTEITSIEMLPILREFVKDAFAYAFSIAFSGESDPDDITNEELESIFTESLSKVDITPVTTTVDIKVVKKGDVWKINMTNTVADAILGGFFTAIDEIGSDFNSTFLD